jgi:hypothetical protein
VHSKAENGRLVFVSDSAGHPRLDSTDRMLLIPTDFNVFDRYRRTSEYKIQPNLKISLLH